MNWLIAAACLWGFHLFLSLGVFYWLKSSGRFTREHEWLLIRRARVKNEVTKINEVFVAQLAKEQDDEDKFQKELDQDLVEKIAAHEKLRKVARNFSNADLSSLKMDSTVSSPLLSDPGLPMDNPVMEVAAASGEWFDKNSERILEEESIFHLELYQTEESRNSKRISPNPKDYPESSWDYTLSEAVASPKGHMTEAQKKSMEKAGIMKTDLMSYGAS